MKKRPLIPYLLILPSMVLLTVFLVYPLLDTTRLSFFDYSYLSPEAKKFVGFKNYIELFTGDDNFRSSLGFTLRFTFACITLEFILGLTIALVLKQVVRLGSLIRTISIFPYMIAAIAAGQMWRLLFNYDYGVVNYVLSMLSIKPVNWLGSFSSAFWACVITEIWRSVPFVMLILLSGLQSIPGDIMEAAKVDGANARQGFVRITFPLLLPSITIALIFETIFKLRVFDIIITLTGGGPGKSTTPLGVLIQRNYFQSFEAGYSGAISVVLLVLGGVISLLYLKFIGTENRAAS
ncbi:sugar ABC transporter permease [Spirochaetia bacterium]|nr:sugar ABC transporter permease [Spirochaetia bacterium]